MFLKEITIAGFKSFADRTKILLHPGVTCIVGPNGCGKSNIVDALRWVLGEQSAKALRGGKMQDVIFEGTDSRKPLPMCEVSLLFTDCEDQLGTTFHEVEITRRATREGGSDYYLNGKNCRLKDIQRLFMDTGIGRVSYSFMVQGQIDQILSTNPSERRLIFEEAAGITKYKSQRQEALQKLGHVEQNLARVTDVVSEINRQTTSLKRQAIKAVRYQKLKHRLTHLDLANQACQFNTRQTTADKFCKEVDVLSQSLEAKQVALKALEAALDERRTARAAFTESVERSQEASFTLKTKREEEEHRRHLASTRREDLLGRMATLDKEIDTLQKEVAGVDVRTQEESQNAQLQLSLVGEVDQSLREKTAHFEACQTALGQAEQALNEARSKRDRLENDIRRTRSEVSSHEVELKTTEAQTTHGEDALSVLVGEVEAAKARLSAVLANEAAVQAKRKAAEDEHKEAQVRVQTVRTAFRDHQDALQKADREVAQKQAELQVLEGLQAKLEGCSEAARSVLQGKLGEGWSKDAFKLLSPQLEVSEVYAPAFEAFLGAAADALIPSGSVDIAAFAQAVTDKKLGRVCAQLSAPLSQSKGPLLPGVKPLLSLVSCAEPAWEGVLAAVFNGAYLAEDLATFLKAWQEAPGFDFRYVVTVKGELVDSRGLVYAGEGGAGKGQGMIQRRAQMKKLQGKIEEALVHQKTVQAEGQKHKESLSEAEAALDAAGRALTATSQEVSASAAEKRVVEGQVLQSDTALTRSRSVLKALSDRHLQAKTRLEAAQAALNKAEAEGTALVTRVQEMEKAIEEKRALRDAAREALSGTRLELSEKRQRLEALQHGKTRLERERDSLKSRLTQREGEKATGSNQAKLLEAEAGEAAARAETFAKEHAEATVLLEKHRESLKEVEALIRVKETEMTQAHHALREVETSHLGLSKKLAEEEAARSLIVEKVQAEYTLEISTIDFNAEIALANQPAAVKMELSALEDAAIVSEDVPFEVINSEAIEWPAVVREVRSLRQSINNLGAVNLVAIDEYVELKERADFLQAQMNDLTQARDAVLGAINEINTTSQALFEDTFKKVQVNFRATFAKLFGGGVADLELVAKDDPLESGIEIIACPPGTKLKSLSLLSGGQKTMTAVALLFSIYQVKPSPFCVLDELDAPLDDANIGRFTAILKEYTEFSQFLVITHNKRTLSAANTLYGVTMPERGVTQLVSLKFETVP